MNEYMDVFIGRMNDGWCPFTAVLFLVVPFSGGLSSSGFGILSEGILYLFLRQKEGSCVR